MKTYILDSYAVLCLFDGKRKPEGRSMMKYFEEAEAGKAKLYLSKVNEGEIYYKLYKYMGEEVANGFREDLKRGLLPLIVVSVNDKRVERASEIKARYPVSYADAFCIELAWNMGLPVVTNDPEFQSVRGIVEVIPLST